MEMVVKRAADYKRTEWSGGVTTELLIWPPTAKYENRDFSYRISSATIDMPVSTFTSLPEYNRILMVLDSEIELLHKDEHGTQRVVLPALDQDHFSGAIETTSYGQCTDFNLMYAPAYMGELSLIESTQEVTLEKGGSYFYYCIADDVNVQIVNENHETQNVTLGKNDSIFFPEVSEAIQLQFNSKIATPEKIAIQTVVKKIV